MRVDATLTPTLFSHIIISVSSVKVDCACTTSLGKEIAQWLERRTRD